jgi:hypothetical protein
MDSENHTPQSGDPRGRHALRCAEVTRELAAPTGTLDPAAVVQHLDSCPRCASWSRRAAALDRLWDATRPTPPPASSWNALWADVSRAAEAPPSDTAPARRRWVRRALIGTLAASAAALLVAVLTTSWFDGRNPHPAVAQGALPTIPHFEFEVESGQLLTLHLDGPAVQADQRPQEETSETETVPWDLELYNGVESITMAANRD